MRASLVYLAAAACASDAGSAPEIANLTYAPSTITAGRQSSVSGTLQFVDEDGDLAQLGVELTLPDASTQALPMSDLPNVHEKQHGTIAFTLAIIPPASGTYRVTLFVTDKAEHESNRLDGTLTAP